MTSLPHFRRSWPAFRAEKSPFAAALLLALILPAAAVAEADTVSRYPFDPACPWGRLANGSGMIHRCLEKDEARALMESTSRAKGSEKKSAEVKSSEKEEKPKAIPKDYTLDLGTIEAEEGEVALGRLVLPKDKYRECVDKNGGLKKENAKVVVQFMVRAERLRAEGTSVASAEGVSARAAECIAEVVDRRQVGTSSVPMTGAKLTFEFKQKK